MEKIKSTTILCVRRDNQVVIGGDGQVSQGNTILKHTVRKVRRLYQNSVIAGFAGGTADAFALFERFEKKLESCQGHLVRAAVELAKEWRTDRVLRHLEAVLIVADRKSTFMITGNGDVIEPENGLIAIGSGAAYAQAAAIALMNNTELKARAIVEESLKIAGDICIYTNQRTTIEELESDTK